MATRKVDYYGQSEEHAARDARGRERERRVNRVLSWAFVIIAALLVGAAIGQVTLSGRAETVFVYCSDDVTANAIPCPPPAGVIVLASWAGGLTTRAEWTGFEWRFVERVVGQLSTREFPDFWVLDTP